MPNTDKQERVSALFADSDRGQCSAIRLYGSAQQAVEVCAAVTTGQQVLEILRSGLCPQVLVLDTLLQGPGLGGTALAVGNTGSARPSAGACHRNALYAAVRIPFLDNGS